MFPVLGEFDVFWAGADDGDAVTFEVGREVEGRLTAELHDDSIGFFLVADIKNVFEGEGLEVELVRGIVVGRDGLGVGINHDRFVAEFAEGEAGVDAAVVELDALADAVWSTPENDDLLFVGLAGFVFVAVGRVVVRSGGFELGGAGVDEAVGWNDAFFFSFGSDLVFGLFEGGLCDRDGHATGETGEGDLAIAEA